MKPLLKSILKFRGTLSVLCAIFAGLVSFIIESYCVSYWNAKTELNILLGYGKYFNQLNFCFDGDKCFDREVESFKRTLSELNNRLENIQSKPEVFDQFSDVLKQRFPDFKLKIESCLANEYTRQEAEVFYDDLERIRRIIRCIKWEKSNYLNRLEAFESFASLDFKRNSYEAEFEYLWLTDIRKQTLEEWVNHRPH